MGLEYYKPIIVMVLVQFVYSGVTLMGRAALLQDMSSRVFVVYRQCIAFLLIAPLAFFSRRKRGTKECYLGWKSFWWIFLLSFVGVTVNQNMYYEGLYLVSSSVASALSNLTPAITFIVAYIFGLEKVGLRSRRSLAKIIGTVVCVSGAAGMALFKGPVLLGSNRHDNTWLLGYFLLLGSSCAWSLWLILQVHVSTFYPDHLSLTAWMCLMAAFQSGIATLIVEPDTNSWKLNSPLQFFCCFYAGLASAVTYFAQAWCISKRGPLFSAMFNPLCTLSITLLACIFLHEELYTGSIIGGLAVIIGLYVMLWGKANDHQHNKEEASSQTWKQNDETTLLPTQLVSEFTFDLAEPLLPETLPN